MFAFIRGKIISTIGSTVTVEDKTGTIGYSLQVAQPHLFIQGSDVLIYTYMHWNQENGPSFFGFLAETEKTVFLLIISCSGIGPKIALALLSELTPTQFLQAIQEGNVKALSAVTGIGTKKAEQIILTLKDKVMKLIQNDPSLAAQEDNHIIGQWNKISQVLQSLNYTKGEIEAALRYVSNEYTGAISFDELLRKSLSFLSKRR